MFAYTKIFTYLSTAKNSNKEHLACGKDKHKIRETHSLWRNLFNLYSSKSLHTPSVDSTRLRREVATYQMDALNML